MDEPARVLVVDPVAAVRRHVAELLEHHGCSVWVCRDLGEALGALAGESFGVVVTELVLPDAQGPEVVTRLRQAAPAAHVIACTALARRDVVVAARLAGVSDFIAKPVQAQRLVGSVRERLHRSGVGG
ncbi:MAG TPA: response regulator [Bacillota bacterium]